MAYATAAELRARINKTSAADDVVLNALLDAASYAIDRVPNHQIEGVLVFDASAIASAREYAGSGRPYQWMDECTSVTLVEVKSSVNATAYTAWAVTDWLTFTGAVRHPNCNDTPYTGLLVAPNGNYSLFSSGNYGNEDAYFDLGGLAYSDLSAPQIVQPTVRITATWGVTDTVPDIIREVCVMLAARWWKRLESAMSDTLASGELGQLLYTQPIDPDVKFLLMNTRYYRPQVARRY